MLLMHPKSDPFSLPPLSTLTWIASVSSDLPIFTSPFCPPAICSQPSSPGEFICSPVLRTFCLLPSRIKGPAVVSMSCTIWPLPLRPHLLLHLSLSAPGMLDSSCHIPISVGGKKKKAWPESRALCFIWQMAQDTASQITLRDYSEEANGGWGYIRVFATKTR